MRSFHGNAKQNGVVDLVPLYYTVAETASSGSMQQPQLSSVAYSGFPVRSLTKTLNRDGEDSPLQQFELLRFIEPGSKLVF